MRRLAIALLTIGALVSLVLCGSYGWDQATEYRDRAATAFVYAFVAACALALHGFSLHLWVSSWRKTGFVTGVVAFLAFVMTAFTSLGGLASRADKVIAERQDVLSSKADIKGQIDQLVTERNGLKFSRASQATVDAARMLAEAATRAREQECGKLGDNCRKRQDAEGAALASLATAQGNKAATDRAAEIDADLKRLRALPAGSGVGAADPMKAFLANIFGAWADLLTAWQKAVFAVIFDLCLVVLMLCIEATTPTRKPESDVSSEAPHSENVSTKPEIVDISPPIRALNEPVRLPVRPKPRLAAANKQPVGAVLDFIGEGLDFADGPETEMVEAFIGYDAWCRRTGKRPLDVVRFTGQLEAHCKEFGIRIRTDGDRHYLRNVRLAG